MKKTRAEWQRQAKEFAHPVTIHYFWDARHSPPSIRQGHALNEWNARSHAYEKVGTEKFNKAVIEHKESGQVLCELRRDAKTGDVRVKDIRYDEFTKGE